MGGMKWELTKAIMSMALVLCVDIMSTMLLVVVYRITTAPTAALVWTERVKVMSKIVGVDYENGKRTAVYVESADGKEKFVAVRHGEWVDGHCTECGEEAMYSTFDEAIYDYDWEENLQYSHTETNVEYHLTDYCPHCGAKMRKE